MQIADDQEEAEEGGFFGEGGEDEMVEMGEGGEDEIEEAASEWESIGREERYW